jgi:dienelactone hydrolase
MRFPQFFLALAFVATAHAQLPRAIAPIEQMKPSATDPALHEYDEPNAIVRPAHMNGAPIALFMPGTHGQPMFNSLLMRTIAGQGYRVIGLEYPDDPAVNQVCPNSPDPDCSANFRAMRLWGDRPAQGSSPVTNTPADSISGRLVSLLRYLDKHHPAEHWGAFITADGQPVWSRIVVSGQSQGAGMAAYIARRYKVARVVCFSSPEDFTRTGNSVTFAPWLSAPGATPPDRWYATRNSREPFNKALTHTYPLLGIPADHVKVFTLDLPAGKDGNADPMLYHGSGIRDPRYIPAWQFLYGNASDVQ